MLFEDSVILYFESQKSRQMMKIGEKILRVESCPSSNEIAKELAEQCIQEGTVVIADEQTKGKGTKGRTWFSVRKKGLYMSVILRPSRSDVSLLPLMSGVAVCQALFQAEGIVVQLKWPNDLVWRERKLGGILCESSFSGSRLNYVILGFGLNMSQQREDFPEEIRSTATSLRLITKREVAEEVLLEKFWDALDNWYSLFLQGKEKKIVKAYLEYSLFPLGETISVETDKGHELGIYQGVDSNGSLILEMGGKKRTFFPAQIRAIKGLKEE